MLDKRFIRENPDAVKDYYGDHVTVTATADATKKSVHIASIAEANGAEAGLAVLDAIAVDAVSGYQPYWAVRAHLLQRLGKTTEALEAYDRAIGLAEDPAVREFLFQQRG